jgi:hypothetical protein
MGYFSYLKKRQDSNKQGSRRRIFFQLAASARAGFAIARAGQL